MSVAFSPLIVYPFKGDFFYVVESGQVNFVDGAEIVGSCTDGGSFGELALLCVWRVLMLSP